MDGGPLGLGRGVVAIAGAAELAARCYISAPRRNDISMVQNRLYTATKGTRAQRGQKVKQKPYAGPPIAQTAVTSLTKLRL